MFQRFSGFGTVKRTPNSGAQIQVYDQVYDQVGHQDPATSSLKWGNWIWSPLWFLNKLIFYGSQNLLFSSHKNGPHYLSDSSCHCKQVVGRTANPQVTPSESAEQMLTAQGSRTLGTQWTAGQSQASQWTMNALTMEWTKNDKRYYYLKLAFYQGSGLLTIRLKWNFILIKTKIAQVILISDIFEVLLKEKINQSPAYGHIKKGTRTFLAHLLTGTTK